jgi:hypothetical protein
MMITHIVIRLNREPCENHGLTGNCMFSSIPGAPAPLLKATRETTVPVQNRGGKV